MENKKYYVYVHILPDYSVYVGSSGAKNPWRRWGNRPCYENKSFLDAILRCEKDYNIDWKQMEHRIIFKNLDRKHSFELEKKLTIRLRKNWIVYNINDGGDPWITGKHHSEETKQKIKLSNIGKNKGKIGIWYGKHLPEDMKKKISKSHKGIKLTEKQKDILNKCRTGNTYNRGRITINNGKNNKRIYPDQFAEYEKLGYIRGMLKNIHKKDQ